MEIKDFNSENKPTWCLGCGNFAIHTALKKALSELEISPSQTFISFDIGCNGNGADKINTYGFKGLHGRSIPLAAGAHLANTKFTVIADIGDGGCLHEGLDHLIHAVRSNYDITILIHNNGNFALTTGQATATTEKDTPMYGLPDGKPENDLQIADIVLNLNPSFFGRGFSGDPLQLSEIIKAGIQHKGCSVIEIMQLCPSYNKEHDMKWFIQNIKKVTDIEGYDNKDINFVKDTITSQNGRILTGVLFSREDSKTFLECLENRKGINTELVDEVDNFNVEDILKKFE